MTGTLLTASSTVVMQLHHTWDRDSTYLGYPHSYHYNLNYLDGKVGFHDIELLAGDEIQKLRYYRGQASTPIYSGDQQLNLL